jgi:hypothetical protein
MIHPPVLKRTDWSPLNILVAVFNRTLPVPHSTYDPGLIEIGMMYVLMISFLANLLRAGRPNALVFVSMIGSRLSWLSRWWNVTFRETFKPSSGPVYEILAGNRHVDEWHMRVGPALWILPALLVSLLCKDLDHCERG